MRQIFASVPRGKGEEALAIAAAHRGTNLVWFPATGQDRGCDMLIIHVPNDGLDPLLARLQQIDNLHVSFFPQGVIALKPPAAEAPQQVQDVTHRSPVEVFLGGIQSVGSWKGFLSYAVASGIVAWVGMYSNVQFLLTASMLIAPFAGPAMNLALGTARGDKKIIRRSIARYFASLAVAIFSATGLTLLVRQEIASELMVQLSQISAVSVLLPIVAGAAGALHLCQSERSSLVTAAGTGVLVAASLAPPAAILGTAIVLHEWSMMKGSAFLLLLQLAGINFSGAIVFALFGLSPAGVRFDRGKKWLCWTSSAATLAALVCLLAWQFHSSPDLQRSTRSKILTSRVTEIINSGNLATAIEVKSRFTRSQAPGENPLLVEAYVQRRPEVQISKSEIQEKLASAIQQQLRKAEPHATPLVSTTVLD